MNAKLYIVSSPIGIYEDISLRAINILKSVDFIICEEFKEARRLLSHYHIEKELHSLNEHNENESSQEIFQKIKEGKSAALISDCGTPLFSDPGNLLVQMCISVKIDVVAIPGASSLLPALVGSTKIVIAFDLTLPTEKYFRGIVSEILKIVSEKNLKGEFVLIINNK